jgi:O-glycosyl hydrolase
LRHIGFSNYSFSGPAIYFDDFSIKESNIITGNIDITFYHQEFLQEIDGFGGSGAFYENWLYNHLQKEKIYNLIFNELGTDIYRIRNAYNIHLYDKKGNVILGFEQVIGCQVESIRAAEDSDDPVSKLMISSWTPPPYLKSKESYDPINDPPNSLLKGGTLAWSSEKGLFEYEEFGKWWADSLDYYNSNGLDVNFDYISIQNEPDCGPPDCNHDSCLFDPFEYPWPFTVNAGYKEALIAVNDAITVLPQVPKIVAPETKGLGDPIFGTTGAPLYIGSLDKSLVHGYAHHLYDIYFDNPDSANLAMNVFHTFYGEKPIFQTEYGRLQPPSPCSLMDDDSYQEALYLAKHMHNSMTVENATAYMTWGLFWRDERGEEGQGLVLIHNPFPADENRPDWFYPGYRITDKYYAFKHFSKFIDTGWERVDATINSDGLFLSAYINPSRDKLTLVLINMVDEVVQFSPDLGIFIPYRAEVYQTVRPCRGDIDQDGEVNQNDLDLISEFFGSSQGDLKYNPLIDLNHDCEINVFDLVIVSNENGRNDCVQCRLVGNLNPKGSYTIPERSITTLVFYRVLGDLNGDGNIDYTDYHIFRGALGNCMGSINYLSEADYDDDGCITYADYRIWYGYFRSQ